MRRTSVIGTQSGDTGSVKEGVGRVQGRETAANDIRFDFAAAAAKRRAERGGRYEWVLFPELCHEFKTGKTRAYELMHDGVLPRGYRIGRARMAWDRHELDIAHERMRANEAFVSKQGEEE